MKTFLSYVTFFGGKSHPTVTGDVLKISNNIILEISVSYIVYYLVGVRDVQFTYSYNVFYISERQQRIRIKIYSGFLINENGPRSSNESILTNVIKG